MAAVTSFDSAIGTTTRSVSRHRRSTTKIIALTIENAYTSASSNARTTVPDAS